MTEKIAHDFKNRLDRLILKPGSGGVFEVRVNGQDIYSKKQTGEFPDEDAIVAQLATLLPAEG